MAYTGDSTSLIWCGNCQTHLVRFRGEHCPVCVDEGQRVRAGTNAAYDQERRRSLHQIALAKIRRTP